MKHLGVLILFIAFCFNLKAQKSVTACLSKDEKNLYDLIMAYLETQKKYWNEKDYSVNSV